MVDEVSGQKKSNTLKYIILFALVSSFGMCCLCTGLGGGLIKTIKSSDAYAQSLRHVQNDAVVKKALGTPIKAKFMVMGNINISDDSGVANLTYSVSGPKGEADVEVKATRSFKKWRFQRIAVKLPDGKVTSARPLLKN